MAYLLGEVVVPVWALYCLPVGGGLAVWFWCWARLAQAADARREAKRAAVRLAHREQVRRELAGAAVEAPAGVPPGPRSIRPDDDLDRYIAGRAEADATAIRTAVLGEPVLDLDTAHDVYGTDDDPEDERDEPPAGEPVAVYHSAIGPRYDWVGRTGWDPLTGSTLPPARPAPQGLPWGRGLDLLRRVAVWPLAPVRFVRWAWAGRSFRAGVRADAWEAGQDARDEAEAQRLLGYDPDLTAVVARHPVARPPAPRSHLPVHVWRRKAVSVAALLGGELPARPAGRHRFGEAGGALVQRQCRLIALPAGAR